MKIKRGKIVLHLGPPKTATTALQAFFAGLGQEHFIYGGISPGRPRDASSMADRLRQAVNSEDGELHQNIRCEFIEVIESGQILLISEEMLLAHEPEQPLQAKILRLGRIINGIDCCAVVVCRNPRSALPSYYQQIYGSLDDYLQKSFSDFCRSEYALVFNYKQISELFLKAGIENVNFVGFEKIVDGYCAISEFLNAELSSPGGLIRIDSMNVGAKATSSRVCHKLSLGERIHRIYNKYRPNRMPCFGFGRFLSILGKTKPILIDDAQLEVPEAIVAEYPKFFRTFE